MSRKPSVPKPEWEKSLHGAHRACTVWPDRCGSKCAVAAFARTVAINDILTQLDRTIEAQRGGPVLKALRQVRDDIAKRFKREST